jgi:hypothetical protein
MHEAQHSTLNTHIPKKKKKQELTEEDGARDIILGIFIRDILVHDNWRVY